jgi:NADPH:quinone reductase-like Zn-dependent oxidoreductase
MDAAVLHTLGKPPRFEQFPEPIAGEGEAIVHVRAAALKPVDRQMAQGTHYASPRNLPAICGIDGVGRLEDGTRVYFGGPRPPYGAMAQRTVVSRLRCFPVAEGADEVLTAALVNPATSAWLTLTWSARLAPGETVLVLGATGVTGRLAVQIAKLLGAGRIVAAGRNEKKLPSLLELGADATIRLDSPDQELKEAFVREASEGGFHVIVDYLWGRPTETLLSAITRKEFAAADSDMRLVQVGESAGPTIALPAAVLRSTPLRILGTGGIPPQDILTSALQQVMVRAAQGQLSIEVETVALADIELAWQRSDQSGGRLVIVV